MQKEAINKKLSNESNWFIFDAKDRVLGRLSTQVAKKLMGKDSAHWAPNVDPKINVVIINANKVAVTGKKETDKTYYRYSGYPGGLKKSTLKKVRDEKSPEIIYHAVKGMLPKNRLGEKFIGRLFVYPTSDHPHQAQKPVEVEN